MKEALDEMRLAIAAGKEFVEVDFNAGPTTTTTHVVGEALKLELHLKAVWYVDGRTHILFRYAAS